MSGVKNCGSYDIIEALASRNDELFRFMQDRELGGSDKYTGIFQIAFQVHMKLVKCVCVCIFT